MNVAHWVNDTWDEADHQRFESLYTIDEYGCWVWHGPTSGANNDFPVIAVRYEKTSARMVAYHLNSELGLPTKRHRETLLRKRTGLCENNLCINPDHHYVDYRKAKGVEPDDGLCGRALHDITTPEAINEHGKCKGCVADVEERREQIWRDRARTYYKSV